jgi:hypothetical protein
MKNLILIVLMAMVIAICGNAYALECGKLSKKAMTLSEARVELEALQAAEPNEDWRFPRSGDECGDCMNKDQVVWGNVAMSGNFVKWGLSICDLPPENKFNRYRDYEEDPYPEWRFRAVKGEPMVDHALRFELMREPPDDYGGVLPQQ